MKEDSSSSSDSTDSDPVVKEIPIFHSKRLENELYLFQYPLRPKDCKNEMNIRNCFFKPQNQEVKLEVEINMESTNFDSAKAEAIAAEIDGTPDTQKKDKEVVFENGIVDKVLFTSNKVVDDVGQYAVGVFNGRELHLTALKGMVQMRPNFTFMNNKLKRKRETEHSNVSSEDEEEAGPSTAQQVTVKFKQSENERWKKATVNSYKTLQRKSQEEAWVPCKWHTEDSATSEVQKLKLYSDNMEDTGQAMNITDSEYIKILIPEDRQQLEREPLLPSNVMSLHALRAKPILEQCKHLLKDARIIQFQQLVMLLTGSEGTTVENLLKTLPKVAVLVQGNWIVKSDIIYPQGTLSSTSGVPADVMCRARDYALLLFKQNQYVERRKVSSVIRIPSEEIKEIFTGISKLRHNKGWELALPTDHDFIAKYPDVVARQNSMWEQRSRQISEFLKDSKDKKPRRKSKSVSEECKSNKSDIRDCNGSSENESGTEKSKSPVVAKKVKVNKGANDNASKNECVSAKS